MIQGVPETICERCPGRRLKRVPPETHALVRYDKELRKLKPGDRLSKQARHAEVLLFHPEFKLHFKDILAEVPNGNVRFTLSLDCVVTDASTLRARMADGVDQGALSTREVGENIESDIQTALREIGSRRDLTKSAFWEAVDQEILQWLTEDRQIGSEWGIRIEGARLRRVITEEEYLEQNRAEQEFRQKLQGIADDTKISDAAAASRLDIALAEIEANKQERIRSLLTEEEKEKSQTEQVNIFLQLYGLPARASVSRSWWFKPLLKVALLVVVAAAAWMLREPAFSNAGGFCYDNGWYGPAFHFYSWASNADLDDVQWHRMVEKCAKRGRGELPKAFVRRYTGLIASEENAGKHSRAILHNYLGNAYLLTAKSDTDSEAARQYERALQLAPELVSPLMNLGIIRARLGKLEEAEDYMRRYLEECPDDGLGWNNLGWLYLKAEKWDDAADALRKALQRAPTSDEACRGLGHVYFHCGDETVALAQYQRALILNEDQPQVVKTRVETLKWKLWKGNLGGGFVTRGFEGAHREPRGPRDWRIRAEELLSKAREKGRAGEPNREWAVRALCAFEQSLILKPDQGDVHRQVEQLRAFLTGESKSPGLHSLETKGAAGK